MASFKSIMMIVALVAAIVACASAQLVPIAGTRDLTGGYYDHYSGQYSSAITGRVYNTAPAVAVAAPAIAHTWAGHAIAAPVAAAPVAWIRR